jgi:hypothetical protein
MDAPVNVVASENGSIAETPLVRFVVDLLWICCTTGCRTCRKLRIYSECTTCCTTNPQQIEQVEFELLGFLYLIPAGR